MPTRRSVARLVVVALLVAPLGACGYFNQLSALRTFKEANTFYGRGDYAGAVERYEEIVQLLEETGEAGDTLLSEQLTYTYFYLGNSYDNLYRPGRTEDAENNAYLERAITNYELAVDKIDAFDLKKLSMQYLVSAFGPDKANDPARSEPVLRQMILLDPEDPDNYFALANLYEQSGLYEDAEAVMLEVKNLRPDDPIVYLQLAGFYNRSGEFELTIDALQQRARIEPNNPEAYYAISTYYWEKAFRDFRITQDQKGEYIMAGLEAADQAIGLNERYVDALVYKNILLRMQANMTSDIDEQESLIAQADELRERAEQLQKEQQSGPAAGEA